MACEPDDDCLDCVNGVDVLDCDKAKQIRCKLLTQLEKIICMPAGPVELEGIKYESKSAAIKSLRDAIDWTYTICAASAEDEGPAIEWVGPQRCTWWGCNDTNC